MLDWSKGKEKQEDIKSDYITEMQSAMDEICKMLSKESLSFDARELFAKVYSYITNKDRLLYTNITNYIFSLRDEEFGILQTNIDNLVSYMYSNQFEKDFSPKTQIEKSEYERTQRTILKMWDHINLARRQYELFHKKDEAYEKIVEEKMEIVSAKMSKEMNGQLISLVAIFTALSFIVFGGISSLDNIFLGAKDIPVTKLMIVGTLWCFCIMNLVFVFLFFVAKMTSLNIKSSEDINANLVQKYPLIWWCNLVLISVLALSCWAYYIKCEKFSVITYYFLMEHSTAYFVIGTFFIVSIIVATTIILYKMSGKKVLKKERGA